MGIRRQVSLNQYRLSPLLVYRRAGPTEAVAQWSARDAWVLKWLALSLTDQLPVHPRCGHVRGHGGVTASVGEVDRALRMGSFGYVLRTDIKGYYRHIVKQQCLALAKRSISNSIWLTLLKQFLWYSVEDRGEIHTPLTGISRGCALSPLLGASLLYHVDQDFGAMDDIFYARYMDDFLILTRTRWRLRQCVATLNGYFDRGGFEQHPDKTFIGRVEKGFDWLGGEYDATGLTGLSARTIRQHRERCLRLYERACRQGLTEAVAQEQVQAYRERWKIWTKGML